MKKRPDQTLIKAMIVRDHMVLEESRWSVKDSYGRSIHLLDNQTAVVSMAYRTELTEGRPAALDIIIWRLGLIRIHRTDQN